MLKLLTRLMHCAAIFGTGALIMMLFSIRANAQACYTVYSGCTACTVSNLSEQWCWRGVSTPRPYANIMMSSPGGGFVEATCRAATNLPAQTVCEPVQPSDPNQRNVYRFNIANTKDHLLTLNWSEGVNAGGAYEGIAFAAYVSPIDANMHPLYRCYWSSKTDHFVSTQSNCEGHVNEGAYGYVSSTARSGFAALYRLFIPSATDHLSTTNPGEAVSGINNEGIQGYVPQ